MDYLLLRPRSSLRATGLVALAVLAACGGRDGSTEPPPPPAERPITFISDRDGYLAGFRHAPGTPVTRITSDTFDSVGLVHLAPDGRRTVLEGRVFGTGFHRVWRADASGSGPLPLTEPWSSAQRPVWSPDGRRIAFYVSGGEIYVTRSDGSDPVNVTVSEAGDVNPSWSPDGASLVFTSYRDGNAEIYRLAIDMPGAAIRLTTSPGEDNYPDWSPDGQRIVFASDRAGQLDLYTMSADGTGVAPLRATPALETTPVWSPDGAAIAYASDASGDLDIWTIRADGSNPVNVTQRPGVDHWPRWR